MDTQIQTRNVSRHVVYTRKLEPLGIIEIPNGVAHIGVQPGQVFRMPLPIKGMQALHRKMLGDPDSVERVVTRLRCERLGYNESGEQGEIFYFVALDEAHYELIDKCYTDRVDDFPESLLDHLFAGAIMEANDELA